MLWVLKRKGFVETGLLSSKYPQHMCLNHSRRDVVTYKQKYVHKVLVNCLFKLAWKKYG